MKLLVVTALYPPDVATPAPYIKELVTRLTQDHQVDMLVYGSYPESVPGVSITTIPKGDSTLKRILQMTKILWRIGKNYDKIIIQNSPSTEVPLLLTAIHLRKKVTLQYSDTKVRLSGWRGSLHRVAKLMASNYISLSLPIDRPEIHPLKPTPTEQQTTYTKQWTEHLAAFQSNV